MALVPAQVLVVLAVVPACKPSRPVEPIANPAEGLSIAVYAKGEGGFGVVDDRRWVEVVGDAITLDRIDAAAPLPALVIEPIGRSALAIGACVRERIDPTPDGLQRLAQAGAMRTTGREPAGPIAAPPAGVLSPLVRCHVTGASGRQLVRVVHVAPAIRFRAQHDVRVGAPDRATIETRFALATPAWHVRAEVALFDGPPGGAEPAREVAHGTVVLDGATALLEVPPRTAPATVRRIYDGAVRDRDTSDADPGWGRDSRSAVAVVLEVERASGLGSGGVRIRTELPGEPLREVEVPLADREVVGDRLRLPLGIDDTLHGSRKHRVLRTDRHFLEAFELAVSSTADEPREVWIEERLRSHRRYEITRARPARPVVVDRIARARVVVAPRATERTSFLVDYAP